MAIVTTITNDIPVDAWARATFEQEGFAVIAAHWFPGPNGLFFDITGRRTDANGEVVRRTTVRQDGARFFSLNTICPTSQWNELKENFWAAHVTFELSHPRKGGAEERRLINTREPAFRVEYPASWEAELATSRERTVSGLHIRLLTADKKDLDAYLLVRAEAAAESGAETLLDQALKLASQSGVTLQGQPQPLTEAEDPRAVAVEGWIGGYSVPAHMGDADVTLKLGFLRRGDLNFTFLLCSPKATTDLFSALRAQRTLEIVRASLQLPVSAPRKKRSR